jgi:PIN domain nuclease of toxin-antitoxin system
MRLLLDTQIFVWSVQASTQLSTAARRMITDADAVFVSVASIWELAYKAQLKRLEGDVQALADAIEPSGFHELAVTGRHAAAVSQLPLHHSDPFDRLLLAQSFSEPLHLLTADRRLAAYGGNVRLL